jgi:two-component system, chemotaxis family, chemotaxis protein CheY
MLLGSRDWTICGEADNGLSGVEKFEELKPDVVIVDLAMPNMDGIQTAAIMSTSDPTVPIILFTILGIDGIQNEASKAGIRAIVPKNNAWSLISSNRESGSPRTGAAGVVATIGQSFAKCERHTRPGQSRAQLPW